MNNGEQSRGDQPMSRQEANEAYGRLKLALVWAMFWSLVIAGLIVYFGDGRRYVYLVAGAIVVLECITTPLWLRYFRRRFDERVRAGEEALGKEALPRI